MVETAGHVEVEVRAALEPFRRGMAAAERETRAFDTTARRSLTGTERAIGAMTGGMRRAERAVLSLRGALVGIGAGIAIRKVVGDFAAFERGLIGVGKTTNIAGEQLQELGRGVQDIAREVPIATTELLSIAQAAGQLGVTGNANLLRFTATVGKLGLASNLAGEEAATSLARILTVTGTAISDVDRLGATIVDLGNNFAATESEIASATTRVAQSTAQFSVTAAEVTSIGTALTAVGVQAEAGGTVIGRAFQSINDAVRGGGDAMREMSRITGLTRKELSLLFAANPTAAFQKLVEGLGRINDEGGDVAAALANIGLEGVRSIQVLGTLATRSEVLSDALERGNRAWEENTALNREALAAASSFTAQMQLVANDVNEAAVAIGRELAPEILKATGAFRDFIQEAERSGAIKDFAQDTAGAMAFLADNIDTVTAAGGALLGLRLGAAFGPWGALIGAAAGAMGGYALATGDAETAAGEHVRALANLRDRLREVDTSNTDAAGSARDDARANIEAARAALHRAQAELQLARAVTQAEMSAMVVGAPDASIEGNPRVRAAHEQLALLREELKLTDAAYAAFEVRLGKGDRLDIAGGDTPGVTPTGGAGGISATGTAIDDLIDSLRTQVAVMRESDPVKREMLYLAKEMAGATAEEREEVQRLVAQIENLNRVASHVGPLDFRQSITGIPMDFRTSTAGAMGAIGSGAGGVVRSLTQADVAEGVKTGVSAMHSGLENALGSGFATANGHGQQISDHVGRTADGVLDIPPGFDRLGDRFDSAIGQQTNALVTGLQRMEAQAAAANAANTSGAFGGSAGGSRSLTLRPNDAKEAQLDLLSAEARTIQAGLQFKQLTPDQTRDAEMRLAEISLESAKLSQAIVETAAAMKSLVPMISQLSRAGASTSQIIGTVGVELKHLTGDNPFGGYAGAFADGGTIPRGKFGIVGEAGPELIKGPADVIPMQRQQAAVTHNNNDNSRGDINISVNVPAQDGGGDSRQSSRDRARQIANEVAYELRAQGII